MSIHHRGFINRRSRRPWEPHPNPSSLMFTPSTQTTITTITSMETTSTPAVTWCTILTSKQAQPSATTTSKRTLNSSRPNKHTQWNSYAHNRTKSSGSKKSHRNANTLRKKFTIIILLTIIIMPHTITILISIDILKAVKMWKWFILAVSIT